MRKVILLFFLFILGSSILPAQKLDHVLGDLLIRPAAGQKVEALVSELTQFRGVPTRLQVVERVSRPLNIWRLHFDHTVVHETQFLRHLQEHKKIQTAQFNHLVSMRETIPNDTFFDDQWQYINQGQNGGVADADIDAELAWDITTGGVTVYGDTIVVAVLDDGIDTNHEDFGDNLWINHAEIPNNQIDDDGNGYVDDYRGWSIVSDDDNINGGGHGTPVAGIIGAEGNNDRGVAGVNWKVKVMVIKNNFNTNEAAVLEAYTYALEARLLYNETNGAQGAFVVATNASWGVDFGQPEDAPLWCAFYDTLGQAGILSCGATINGNHNVDEVGDLPTACPSDFMIAVTNMGRTDTKVTQAGYGATTIDLGAFGASAFTTANNNSYNGFGGTSGATPHVTGAIALLYSAPCENLPALAISHPAQAALLARQYIFEGVEPNESLAAITTTGGRLNLYNSLLLLLDDCAACPTPVGLSADSLTESYALLDWVPVLNTTSTQLRWRTVGAPTWNFLDSVAPPVALEQLSACTDYEFAVAAICDTLESEYAEAFSFRTDGCCLPPDGLQVYNIGLDQATISWNGVTAAASYNVFLSSPLGTTLYEEVTTSELSLFDLLPCETYNVSVQTNCADSTTAFNTPLSFTTLGCGACLDFEYCTSAGNSNFEWIESVEIGAFSNVSTNDGGYVEFLSPGLSLHSYSTYPVVLTPGFASTTYGEYFKIWIDFDQDGTFDPVSELAFDGLEARDSVTTGLLVIPGEALPGNTRMRVSMEWEGNDGQNSPEACEELEFGEVEDYCIEIIEGSPSTCDLATVLDTLEVLEQSAVLSWADDSDDHIDHDIRIKRINETDWNIYENVVAPYEVINLVPCQEYEFQVRSNCADGVSESEFTESFVFQIRCSTTSSSEATAKMSAEIFPNPFAGDLMVDLRLPRAGDLIVQILDINGRILHQDNYLGFQGARRIHLSGLDQLTNGVYFLFIKTEGEVLYHKLVKASK